MKVVCSILILLAICLQSVRATESAALGSNGPAGTRKPRIEVCFVLDTTGSMSGLIEGAKEKIWSIANDMIRARAVPELKIGLVGYRDRGDEYGYAHLD